MKFVQANVPFEQVQELLKRRDSGLGLTFPVGEFTVHKVLLEGPDAQRLILWWQHTANTDGKSKRVTDAGSTARVNTRINRLIEGDGEKGLKPIDVRRDTGFDGLQDVKAKTAIAGSSAAKRFRHRAVIGLLAKVA